MKNAQRLLMAALVLGVFALPAAIAPTFAGAQSISKLPTLGDVDREYLSPLNERKLGEAIMQDVRRNRDYLDDGPILEYLNNFGNDLVAAHPEARGEAAYNFFFFAVRDPMLNAFALPGGFIAVHSALVLAAQSESELASVLAHEIGHVAQRHIARMLGEQSRDSWIPLAGALLALLSARATSSDAPMAILSGSQGIAIQRQLNFSRDAEREADRVGFDILGAAGFDTSGMVAFFGRLQTATRSYSDLTPPYLRSHPMTTERIADIQGRIRDQRYKQRADSLDFHLIRARIRVLQDESAQGLRDSAQALENQLLQKSRQQTIAAQYGLAFVALKQGDAAKAQDFLKQALASAEGKPIPNAIFDQLSIEIALAAKQPEKAMQEAALARTRSPLSRSIARQYAEAAIAAGHHAEASVYLRDQIMMYHDDPRLYSLLAQAYSGEKKLALQHMALAESYALSGALQSALEQLADARRAPDASFYDQSMIDAREREWQAKRKEELNESKKSSNR